MRSPRYSRRRRSLFGQCGIDVDCRHSFLLGDARQRPLDSLQTIGEDRGFRFARNHSTVRRSPSSKSVVARHPSRRAVSSTSTSICCSNARTGTAPKTGSARAGPHVSRDQLYDFPHRWSGRPGRCRSCGPRHRGRRPQRRTLAPRPRRRRSRAGARLSSTRDSCRRAELVVTCGISFVRSCPGPYAKEGRRVTTGASKSAWNMRP